MALTEVVEPEGKKFIVKTQKSYYERTSVVSVRFPNSLPDKLDVVSDKTGRSRNELILMCVDSALDNIPIVDEEAAERDGGAE